MARLRPVFAPWVTAAWIIALALVVWAIRRTPRAATFDAVTLLLFAALYGALVAYSHLVELRYVAPILPFVWTAAALAADGATQRTRI